MATVTVYITPEANQALWAYTTLAKSEITGLGEARVDSGKIVISRIILLRQKVTGMTCEIDQDDLAASMAMADDLNAMKVWWHSHHTMSPFLSATDRETVTSIMRGAPWLITIVTNHNREYLLTVHVKEPPVEVEADLRVLDGNMDQFRREIAEMDQFRREIAEKVKFVRPEPFREPFPFFAYGGVR